MKNGRGRLDVLADTIDAARTDGSYLNLYIEAGQGMSARLFNEYISFLVGERFLTMVPGDDEVYKPTKKGLGFLTKYRKKIKLLLEKVEKN